MNQAQREAAKKMFATAIDNKETKVAALVAQIRKDYPRGTVLETRYVFGESFENTGIVDKVYKPKEGGILVTYYGCSYPRKGYATNQQLWGIDFPKSFLFQISRKFLKHRVFQLAFAFFFVVQRKKAMELMEFIGKELVNKSVKHYDLPEKEYKLGIQEIKRAAGIALKGISAWKTCIEYAIRFICYFLEIDSAYWYRIQDAFGVLVKSGYPIADFMNAINLLISRENEQKEMAGKWKFIKFGIRFILFLEPELKQFLSEFVIQMDFSKLRMDEADVYYSLGYNSYNFGGKNYKERMAIKNRIDDEKGHVFLF